MKHNIIYITTEFIKLDAFLKFAGIAQTGGHAKIIIADNAIKVDGKICTERGKKLYPGTIISFEEDTFEVALASNS